MYANAYIGDDTGDKDPEITILPPPIYIPNVSYTTKTINGIHLPYVYRERTYDLPMFDAVVTHNEYKLSDLRGGIVFDIGAHIGTFTLAAYAHGAGKVYAYEAHPENAWMYVVNTALCRSFGGEAPTLYWGAVIGDRGIGESVRVSLSFPFDRTTSLFNTGGVSIHPSTFTYTVPSYKLDHPELEKATLVKIDIEGAEYWVLAASHSIHAVPQVVGEYHLRGDAFGYRAETHDAAHTLLRSLLPSHTLTFFYQPQHTVGLWFGVRGE